MKWRRGVILAGIHFVIATSLILWVSIPQYTSEKTHSLNPNRTLQLAAFQEEGQTVEFSPCQMWRHITWQERVLVSSELPVAILSGWNEECPAGWSVAGLIGIDARHHTRTMAIRSSAAFSLLIAIQWLILGGLPLVQLRRWWEEPGACITACTVIEVLLLTIGTVIAATGIEVVLATVGLLASVPFLVILCTWLYWLILLLWRTVIAGRRLAISIRKMHLNGRQFLAFLLFLAAILPATAQSARVEGIAVNGASGEPIPGAKIQLCAQPESRKMVVGICNAAISDHAGGFVFSNTRPGHFYLASESKGYLRDALVQNGQGGRDFDVRAGETRRFRLVLWPEGAIIGRIVDEDGEPIAGIDVSAIRDDSSLGRRYVSRYQYWGGPSEVATDKNGEFRIGELKAGRYYVEAFVAAWRKSGEELMKAGYIPAYYPDTPTLEGASMLCIGAGEQRKIEFRLKPRPTHAVRGRIEVPSDFKKNFEPLWGLRRDDGAYYGQFMDEEFDHHSGEWEIRDLPSGSYNLEIQTGIYDTDLVANKSFTITEADVKNLNFTMALRFSLRAKVHVPDGFHSRAPYSVLFNLESDGTAEMTEAGQPLAKDGAVVFSRLQPGHYRLYLFSDGPLYMQSAKLADQDALRDGLSFHGPSNEVLEITLAIAKSELDGVVNGDNGTPIARADVKLIAQGDDAPYVLRSVVSDAQGHFALKGVPPGNYKLIALEEAVRDSEFGAFEFDQVEGQATPIQVRDAPLSGISLKSTNLRYSSSACSLSQLP